MRGKQTSVVFDTPEMRRVRQNTHNFSSVSTSSSSMIEQGLVQCAHAQVFERLFCAQIKYKDSHSKGKSVATMLDTPEMRTARENKKNFSQVS